MSNLSDSSELVIDIKNYKDEEDTIGDDEVRMPNERKSIFLVIKHSPKGMATNNYPAARNYMYHIFEQVYGVELREQPIRTRTHLDQHVAALNRYLKEHPYKNACGTPVLSRRLLIFLLGSNERDPDIPVYAWFNHTVQEFVELNDKDQKDIVNKCQKFFLTAPYGPWMIKKRKDERGP